MVANNTLKNLGAYLFQTEFDVDTMMRIINKMKLVAREKGHGTVTIIIVEGRVVEVDGLMKERIDTDN